MHGRTLTVRVARVEALTPEIKAFELVHPRGGALPGYRAGAHIDVHTPGGFMRQYSLAEAAVRGRNGGVDQYRIGVKREPSGRGGSAALHDRVCEGDLLAISTPRDSFGLQSGDGPHWLLAGGIGITPLLAMAEQMASESRESGAARDFRLFVFTRSREHLPFAASLAALGDRVRLHFDDPSAPEKIDLREALSTPPPGANLYLCGPAGFMRAVRDAASAWDPERVHAEHFAAPGDADADGPRGEPFSLRLGSSGLVVNVASDRSAVEALADLGIHVPVSCEQGLCGTCVVRWSAAPGSGEPVHRDLCLTQGERRHRVALCCARARGGALSIEL